MVQFLWLARRLLGYSLEIISYTIYSIWYSFAVAQGLELGPSVFWVSDGGVFERS